MSSDRKKEIEAFHLAKFRELRPELIPTEPKHSDPPDPDFIVTRNGTTLGIEHTQLFPPTYPGQVCLKEQEELRGMVVRRAQEMFECLDKPPVQVAIHFNMNYLLNKKLVEQLPEAAVSIVLRNFPEVNGSIEESFDWDNPGFFHEEFARISLSRLTGIGNYWHAPGATWVQTLGATCLQEKIEDKSGRCNAYRENGVDELWLLIVSDGFQLSSIVDFEQNAISQQYRTKFNRMFLLHNLTKVYELGCLYE